MNLGAPFTVLVTAILLVETIHCVKSHFDKTGDSLTKIPVWQRDNQGASFDGRSNRYMAIHDQPLYFGKLHTLKAYTSWAVVEEKIQQWLRTRLEYAKWERRIIRQYLKNNVWRRGSETTNSLHKSLTTSTEYKPMKNWDCLKNAVIGYWMTHELASTFRKYSNLLQSLDYSKNFRQFENGLYLGDHDRSWISNEDLYLSMTAFLHLQENYFSSPEQIASALEYEYESEVTLKAVHCAEIGTFALYRKRNYMSVEWLEQTWKLLTLHHFNTKSGVTLHVTKFLIRLSAQEHNKRLSQYKTLNLNPEDLEDPNTYKYLFLDHITAQQLLREKTSSEYDYFYNYHDYSQDISFAPFQYKALCMGMQLQPEEVKKKFKCYLENKRHPYLYINPIKAEVISEDPPIYQFYEMIGEKVKAGIIDTYTSEVRPSQVVGWWGMDVVSSWRTSAGIGMRPEAQDKTIYSLAEFVSGLNILGHSEYTQYLEYTYGRFYSYHGDAVGAQEEAESVMEMFGDRIATMLYYLEIPESGGLTPFCQAGVFPHPVQNSAVLWYNLYRNGTVRHDVDHGACPVIHGHKIVMNHWIHHHGNWNTRKCSLNQFE